MEELAEAEEEEAKAAAAGKKRGKGRCSSLPKYPNSLRVCIKQAGYTFREVSEEAAIPKSTLFGWAAGIAQSWRTNRERTYQDYLDDLLKYHEQQAEGSLDTEAEEPAWKEWDVPTLHQVCIQASVNVAVLEPSQDSTFDYWHL